MNSMREFSERRKKLMECMSTTGIVILPAAPVAYRNAENEYPYRQNSDFYYLTGFNEPDAVAIIVPGQKNGEFILFNRMRDRAEEIWTGLRAGQDGAKTIFGADESYPITELTEKLPELLEGRKEVYYPLGLVNKFDKIILSAIHKIRGKIRSGACSPIELIDIVSNIHEMRLIKSSSEIEWMRKAADISATAHIRAMQACQPGKYEYHLEAEIAYVFQQNGSRFSAYPSIVGSGANSCILHYVTNNQVIQKEDIVLVDAGCEYNLYAADVTRTFPASGQFSAEQKALYEIVLAAQLTAIDTIYPGAAWDAAQNKIIAVITQGLIDLKILKGDLEGLIQKRAYLPFYMHNSGHWLGLDVHDVGWYKINGKWRNLQPGMVLTVEPGIYIASDAEIDSRWHNIGIRIEDDILVTPQGHEILSHRAPKTISDIEAIMRT